MTLKVLVAEDSQDVAQVVAFGARMTWPDCQVAVAVNGSDALRRFQAESPDLVVLDISMPPPDGFEVCRRIRETSEVPILMLTAYDTTPDKVRALDLGADDYLTKPFDHLELLARLRALVRRTTRPLAQPEVDFSLADFSINSATREVRIQGDVVPLTSTEYRLLEELVRHAGTAQPHRVLLEKVWGPEYANEIHYLKIFVQRLRRKLDRRGAESLIRTRRGEGYQLSASEHP